MRVRIAQCLCPERHAIFGFGINDESVPDADVTVMLREAMAAILRGEGVQFGLPPEKLDIHPWCGICGAPVSEWHYEVKRSKEYESWELAQKDLEDLHRRQRFTKRMLDLAGISYDARQAREKARNN